MSHCPTCGATFRGDEPAVPDLSPAERDLLRAARMRRDQGPLRVSDLARWSGWKYGQTWQAANKLFIRGYIERDGKRRVAVIWGRLTIGHRAQIAPLLDADTPDSAELAFGPSWLSRLLAHFGATWEGGA